MHSRQRPEQRRNSGPAVNQLQLSDIPLLASPQGGEYRPLLRSFTPAISAVSQARCPAPTFLLRTLIQPDHVSARISEPRGDLRRIGADRLHDFSPGGDYGIGSRGHAVDHDVNHQAGRTRRWPANDPGATDFAGTVVEGDRAITAFPDVPAENPAVEIGGACNVGRRHFDIADLPVRKRGRHTGSFQASSLFHQSSTYDRMRPIRVRSRIYGRRSRQPFSLSVTHDPNPRIATQRLLE